MLITEDEVRCILNTHNININGILHIGAHECEELSLYENLGIKAHNIIWIDGNKDKVNQAQQNGIPNVYYAIISNEDDKEVEFKITNNGQSSSILDFGSHSRHHPHVHFVETQKHSSITIDTFYEKHNLDMSHYDFWNFDIQGAELLALKGAKKAIEYAKVLYLEVNSEEVYKGCALMTELDDFLSKYNFKRVSTKMTEYGWGDALYIKVT
jgi:FkbM family methyltransferase